MIHDALYQSGLETSDIIITGGTESGYHADGDISHANGYKLDFEDTAGMNTYIESWTQIDSRSNDGALEDQYQNTFEDIQVTCARETTHWDCTYMNV